MNRLATVDAIMVATFRPQSMQHILLTILSNDKQKASFVALSNSSFLIGSHHRVKKDKRSSFGSLTAFGAFAYIVPECVVKVNENTLSHHIVNFSQLLRMIINASLSQNGHNNKK